MPLYEPQEDSELLMRAVEKYARGAVLDMGTGSAIQAIAAARKKEVETVLAVDIDEESLDAATDFVDREPQEVKEKIRLVQSDRFKDLKESFDTICCNPPYLPDEESDAHQGLYGGATGAEWTLAFLDEARDHLTQGGSILLIMNSQTHEQVLDAAKRLGYHAERLEEMAFFFERLYSYRLWRRA